MAIELTVRQGGGTASTTKDYTSQLRIFAVDEGGGQIFAPGNMCGDGSSSQWQFVVDDDSNQIPTQGTAQLAAHNLVTVIEDAPGFDAWIGRGRIAYKEVYRGDLLTEIPVQWRAVVDDPNTHLKGLALTEPWVRPSESGRTRVLAVITTFLSGSPRLTTDLSTDTDLVAAGGEVQMPEHTYPAGTELLEILEDCATVEGKVFSVVIHHVASVSHECLLYVDEADHTTYASTLSITDNDPDYSTEFPPIWDQGAAAIHEGQELATGVVATYGSGTASYVFVQDSDQVDAYDYWAVPYNDNLSTTPSQATTRADAIRDSRKTERVTHQVTIKLPADKIHLVEAGMSITIRSAASMGGQYLNTTQTRRIAQAKKEPVAPEVGAVVGHYEVHMQLDRPIKRLPDKKGLPVGPKPAEPGGDQPLISDSASGKDDDGEQPIPVTVGTHADRVMYVATICREAPTVAWHPSYVNAGTQGSGTALTLVDSQVTDSPSTIYLFRLIAPATSVEATSAVVLTKGVGVRAITGVWVVTGANQTTPETDTSKSTGVGTTSSVTVTPGTNDLIIDVAGWVETNATVTDPAEAGDNTQDFALTYDRTFGFSDYAFGGAHGSDATPAWNFTNSHTWGAIAWAVKATSTGATTQPVGDTGSGTVGDDDGSYVGPAHVHEHGLLSTSSTHHHDADDIEGGGSGDMTKAVYDTDDDGIVDNAEKLTTSQVEVYSAASDDVLVMRSLDNNNGMYLLIQPKGVPTSGDTSWHVYYSRTSEGAADELFLGAGAWHGQNKYLIASGDSNDSAEPLPIRVIMERGTTHYPVMDWDSDSTVLFYKQLRMTEMAAPSTPASGEAVLYVKTDGKIYLKNDAGTEYDLTGDFDHATTDHADVGHYEVLMAEGAADPPDPLETGDGLDWLYVWVTD